MAKGVENFELITNYTQLEQFAALNQSVEWLCFDTEFVGEKRFITRLCLIQVMTEHGNFLIDPFELPDLQPFLDLLAKPEILKITHAGDNDYRLLFNLYDTVPTNIFDTQIAAAFIGYKYPVSFRKLVEGELGISLNKGYAVTDWESRPFKPKQLKYALNDVLPLYDLWQTIDGKVAAKNRQSWVLDECARLGEAKFYYKNPNQEALDSNLMKSLEFREQIFLLRLYSWRRSIAYEKNYSKEMVLPSKLISHIVRGIRSGKDALRQNRRISPKISDRYGDDFDEMYKRPASNEEKDILKEINTRDIDDPKEEILVEMLYLMLKYKCLEEGISTNIVLPRSALKQLKTDQSYYIEFFKKSWRREFLGDTFLDWFKHMDRLKLKILADKIELSF